MAMDKTIRRVTDLEQQQLETYRYWQSRSVAERIAAVDEIVRMTYFAKGIDLADRSSVRSILRVERPDWKAKQCLN